MGHICRVSFPLSLLALLFAIFLVSATVQARYGRKEYLDPELCVEGAGPRRDLTAVEAAVALETPLDRVAAMIFFGLLRKGLVTVTEGISPLRMHKEAGTGEHAYETRFLEAIGRDGLLNRRALGKDLVTLVNEVEKKLEGFDLEATRTYYTAVVERAWKQMERAGTPEEFSLALDEREQWLMMAREPEERFEAIHIHHLGRPGDAHMDIRNMARRYTGRIEVASSQLVRDMESLTGQVKDETRPPPAGSGGGGGGGCACACACACAGGGR